MKKIVTISLFIFWAVVAAILTAGLVFYQNQTSQRLTATSSVNNEQTNGQTQLILNLVEISKHSSIQDCWLLINNKVYDVTGYLTNHPGGASTISPYCGQEATRAFNTKDRGRPHSSSATALLTNYYVGDLNQILTLVQPADRSSGNAASSSLSDPTKEITIANTAKAVLNLAEIAKHKSTKDCWLLINDNVYNITNYLFSHPGGVSAISPYCGQEATNAFNTKDKGSPHSNTAHDLLNNYYVGKLNQAMGSQSTQNAPEANKPASNSNSGVVSGANPSTNNSTSSNLSNITLNVTTIAKHNTQGDCWMIISTKVYNVTAYISSHPGGVANIVNYCGQEASQAFTTKGNRGNPHSTGANNLLANYYIGDLNQTIGQQQIEQNIQQTNSVPPSNSGGEDEFEDD